MSSYQTVDLTNTWITTRRTDEISLKTTSNRIIIIAELEGQDKATNDLIRPTQTVD